MAYLNFDPNYFEHPKTRRLVGLTGERGEIYPIRLWCYCSKYHAENGKFINYSAEEIEAILHWGGEKNLLVNSMTKVGFLNKKGNHYEVNDWKEHEGHIINYKKRSKIAAKARWDKIKNKSNAPSNAKDKPKHPNQASNQASNQALPNQHYLQDKKFAKSFEDYLEMRKKIRKPATNRAIDLVFNKLNEFPIETATKMLEQSIINSWQGIFALRVPIKIEPKIEKLEPINEEEHKKVSALIHETAVKMKEKVNA